MNKKDSNFEYPQEFFLKEKKNKTDYYKKVSNIIDPCLFSNVNSYKESYSLFDKLNMSEKIIIDGPDFKYKINENGFRSKSFKEFNKNNINILFSGCSITAGQGLPEEYTWYKKLYDKIVLQKENKNIDFYNLGLSGSSIQLIYKNLITFIKTVGKPDYIFLLLPNISRNYIYYKEENTFLNANYFEKSEFGFDEQYKSTYSHENSLFSCFSLISGLEELCHLSGIKLLWTSWIPNESEIFQDYDFKYYFNFKENLFLYHIIPENSLEIVDKENYDKENYDFMVKFMNKKNKNNEPYWHSAREGHPGSYFTSVCSEKYFQEFKRRGL